MFAYHSVEHLVYFLVRWNASVVSLPPGDVILALLACPLNGVIVCSCKE
jgi:hypothetical protein